MPPADARGNAGGLVVALVQVGRAPLSRAGAATQTTSPVAAFAGATAGTSTLTRTDSGMSFSLQTSGLQAGHAVTVWWMVFNPDGSVSVQYAAGHVIAHLQVGDTDGVINGGPGLLDAQGAEVVLVVLDHGPNQGPWQGRPADPHLRRLQPHLHRPADADPHRRLSSAGRRVGREAASSRRTPRHQGP
jgi:hypothetical protein